MSGRATERGLEARRLDFLWLSVPELDLAPLPDCFHLGPFQASLVQRRPPRAFSRHTGGSCVVRVLFSLVSDQPDNWRIRCAPLQMLDRLVLRTIRHHEKGNQAAAPAKEARAQSRSICAVLAET